MSLFSQFQAFIGSIVLGWISSLLWIFIETFIKDIKPKILRIFIETPFFIIVFYLYDLFLIHFIDGVLNVFYLFAIVIGVYFYFRFYNKYFSSFFNKIKNILKSKILKPIYLKVNKIKYILKKKILSRKKKRNERQKESKQNT